MNKYRLIENSFYTGPYIHTYIHTCYVHTLHNTHIRRTHMHLFHHVCIPSIHEYIYICYYFSDYNRYFFFWKKMKGKKWTTKLTLLPRSNSWFIILLFNQSLPRRKIYKNIPLHILFCFLLQLFFLFHLHEDAIKVMLTDWIHLRVISTTRRDIRHDFQLFHRISGSVICLQWHHRWCLAIRWNRGTFFHLMRWFC